MLRLAPRYTLFTYSTLFFFFNDTATTEIYTLSLHDALPILLDHDSKGSPGEVRLSCFYLDPLLAPRPVAQGHRALSGDNLPQDRKSTRLNSSHANISYAVFCLKKKKQPELH